MSKNIGHPSDLDTEKDDSPWLGLIVFGFLVVPWVIGVGTVVCWISGK